MLETTSEEYRKLRKKYVEYCELYRFFNHGSLEGVTPFDQFYWRFTYNDRYSDPSAISISNT